MGEGERDHRQKGRGCQNSVLVGENVLASRGGSVGYCKVLDS